MSLCTLEVPQEQRCCSVANSFETALGSRLGSWSGDRLNPSCARLNPSHPRPPWWEGPLGAHHFPEFPNSWSPNAGGDLLSSLTTVFRSSLLTLLPVQQVFCLCVSLFWNGKFRANYVLIIALLSIYIFRLLRSVMTVKMMVTNENVSQEKISSLYVFHVKCVSKSLFW